MNEQNTLILLNDDQGNDIAFEFLDLVKYNGREYVILLPAEAAEEGGEVTILQIEEINSEQESYISVDDEQVLNAVFDIFKEKFQDAFDFID